LFLHPPQDRSDTGWLPIDIYNVGTGTFELQRQGSSLLRVHVLSEIILSFEGVSLDLPARILECFDAVDIGGMLRILRDHFHSRRVIEECYDLLFPDGQLRTVIKAMKVELEIINETLLHPDGYSAEDVASEVHQHADF
jgi:hypothetical protein